MALWELQSSKDIDDKPVCNFCAGTNLDGWYYNEDDNKVMCVPCIWKRNEEEDK